MQENIRQFINFTLRAFQLVRFESYVILGHILGFKMEHCLLTEKLEKIRKRNFER